VLTESEIEEGLGSGTVAVADDLEQAALLGDEEPPGAVARAEHEQWLGEAGGDALELDLECARSGPSPGGGKGSSGAGSGRGDDDRVGAARATS
jgi:hypothetical protein